MKIALCTRERVAIGAIMNRAPWGGSRPLILAQAAVYETLGLAKFVGDDVAKLSSASTIDQTIFEIEDGLQTEVFNAMLTIGGQSAEIALVCVGVLKKLDPVSGIGAAPAEGPGKDAPS